MYVQTATFNPDAYAARDFEHARRLTVGGIEFNDGTVLSCEERWDRDTEFTIDFLLRRLPGGRVLDYGCGTGRIAKGLIERSECEVVGCDESAQMRVIASAHVASDRFSTVSPDRLGGQFDCAYTLWVLQHALNPRECIERIWSTLKPGALLVVFNENGRYVPTIEYGFGDDQIDVRADLSQMCGEPVEHGKLPADLAGQEFSDRTYWAIYRKSAA